MSTLENYEKELKSVLKQLNENFNRAGFRLEQMNDLEDTEIPKDLRESNRRILENIEGLRRRIANAKQQKVSHPI